MMARIDSRWAGEPERADPRFIEAVPLPSDCQGVRDALREAFDALPPALPDDIVRLLSKLH